MLANSGMELNIDVALSGLNEMVVWLKECVADQTAADVVERGLFYRLLEMGRHFFGGFLEAAGNGDLGSDVTLMRPDSEGTRVLKRFSEEHHRRLLTVFGEFMLSRCVYGRGEHKAIEFAPTDQRLKLPEGEVSYLLQEWDQLLGIDQAFGAVRDVIEKVLRFRQSVDTLERVSLRMAGSAEPFREQQPAPDPAEEGELLIVTEDNKGVPIVRPVDVLPPGAHLTKGQKKNKKKFATVGCVYSVDPHVRTPEELVATLFRDVDRPTVAGPPSKYRRYWARMTREEFNDDGEVEQIINGQQDVFEQLQKDVSQRRKPGQKLVHLSDGQHSLETDRQKYLPSDDNTVDVLDLMHVIPRLWQAAHLFHKEGSDKAADFVRHRLLQVLQGKAKSVIADLRRLGTRKQLQGTTKKKLKLLTTFLETNLHRMQYDEYLAAGYPIATGVIEGACRHIVKDRMERTGMRWKIPGAQAMLELRTIHINGDWESFQQFRVESETKRLYPYTTA